MENIKYDQTCPLSFMCFWLAAQKSKQTQPQHFASSRIVRGLRILELHDPDAHLGAPREERFVATGCDR